MSMFSGERNVPIGVALSLILAVGGAVASCSSGHAKELAGSKRYSVQVANGIRRPIGIRINRQGYERVAYHYGSKRYKSSKPSFLVKIWVEQKNGRKKKIYDGRVPITYGNGNGHVKITVYKKSKGVYAFRYQ